MKPEWIKAGAVAVLCITLAVCAGVLTWNARIGIHSFNDTLADVKEYVHSEKATLEDPRNAKAIEAATQVGAVFNASGRLLNTQTLPRANKVLDALQAEAIALKATTDESTRQLKQNGDNANLVLIAAKDTVAGLGRAAERLGVDTTTLTKAIADSAAELNMTVAEVTKRVADPRFDTMLDAAVSGITHIDHISAEIALASDRLPEVADDLHKVSKAAGRFSNAYWVGRIISLIIPVIP